jgi:hypothetical protein
VERENARLRRENQRLASELEKARRHLAAIVSRRRSPER